MNEISAFCNGDISDTSEMCIMNVNRTKELAKAKTQDDYNKFLKGGATVVSNKEHVEGKWYRTNANQGE